MPTIQFFLNDAKLMNMMIELLLQLTVWYFITNWFDQYVQKYLSKHKKLFNYLSKQEGGISEFRAICRCIPQHTFSTIFIWIAVLSNPPKNKLFQSTVIAEIAYEITDILFLYNAYCTDYQKAKSMIYAMFCHHLGGIISIFPLLYQFGSNESFQKLVLSLLMTSPIISTFMIIYKTRDLNDLHERSQFAVSYFIVILLNTIGRWICFPIAGYYFITNQFFINQDLWIKTIVSVYGILISVFNAIFIVIGCYRYYFYLFGLKKNIKQIQEQSTFSLKRWKSVPNLKSF
eukprot:270565_1